MYNIKPALKPVVFLADLLGYIIFSPFIAYNRLVRRTDCRKAGKILVIRLDHIGDMVMTSPVFENIKRNNPECRLSVLCRRLTRPIAEVDKNVDEVIELDPPWFSRGDSAGWQGVFRLCFRYFRHFDIVYELHTDPRHNIISFFLGTHRVGYGSRGLGFLLTKMLRWDRRQRHMADRYLDLLEATGCRVMAKDYSIALKREDRDAARAALAGALRMDRGERSRHKQGRRIIGIHLVTGRKNKNWPLRNWSRLISELSKKYRVVLIGSKHDQAAARKILGRGMKNVHDLCGRFSIRQYFALIDECDYIISPDTLAVHAASAFKKKAIALYGPTSAEVWGPRDSSTAVIQGKYKGCFGRELPECAFLKGKEGPGRCMESIAPERVLAVFRKIS